MTNVAEQELVIKIATAIRQEMEAEVLARFGEKGFRLWHDAPHRQRLLAPTVVGTVKGSCGDTISIALGINGDTIVETDFDTDGCASSQIAAATAASLALGKSLDEAVDISEQTIVTAVGTFPDDDRHCAFLAAAAVREAIHRWMIQGGGFKQAQEADIIAQFGENGFRIWTDASQRQPLLAPSVVGALKGSCGDTISIALRIDGDTIRETDFDTDGCTSSQIAAATAASLALNKTLDEAMDIDEQAIVSAVGVFPDDDRHCAFLAAASLREAVHQWMIQDGVLTVDAGKQALNTRED